MVACVEGCGASNRGEARPYRTDALHAGQLIGRCGSVFRFKLMELAKSAVPAREVHLHPRSGDWAARAHRPFASLFGAGRADAALRGHLDRTRRGVRIVTLPPTAVRTERLGTGGLVTDHAAALTFSVGGARKSAGMGFPLTNANCATAGR